MREMIVYELEIIDIVAPPAVAKRAMKSAAAVPGAAPP